MCKRSNYLLTGFLILFLPNLGFSANINEVSDRVDELEESLELLDEESAELRAELENRMEITGYMDVEYVRSKVDGSAVKHGYRMHHLSLFFKKKISDQWKFFSEIEYEDAPKFDNANGVSIPSYLPDDGNADRSIALFNTADGKIFVEAVSVDFLWKPEAILRFGRFFTPAGIWSVDHYPPFVSTQERPKHIREIFPQLVDGAMIYGTLPVDKHFVNYDAYMSNGEGNDGKSDRDTGKAWGLKANLVLTVPLFSQFEFGGTRYYDSNFKGTSFSKTAIGVHAKIKLFDLVLQSEGAYSSFGDTDLSPLKGYYTQLTYQPSQMSVGYRYDYFDDKDNDIVNRLSNTVFINYRVNTSLVLKFEQHFITQNDKKDAMKTIISVVSYLE